MTNIDNTRRDMMNAAVRLGLTDAVGLALLLRDSSVDETLAELSEIAESDMHTNPKRRAAWIGIRDAVYYFETVDMTIPDKFGFKAQAAARAAAVLTEHRITIPEARAIAG